MNFPQIGKTMSNKHTVDAVFCIGVNRYVLAHRDGAPEPYAIWDIAPNGDTINGRYFSVASKARKEFAQLCLDLQTESADPLMEEMGEGNLITSYFISLLQEVIAQLEASAPIASKKDYCTAPSLEKISIQGFGCNPELLKNAMKETKIGSHYERANR